MKGMPIVGKREQGASRRRICPPTFWAGNAQVAGFVEKPRICPLFIHSLLKVGAPL